VTFAKIFYYTDEQGKALVIIGKDERSIYTLGWNKIN